VLGYHTQAGWAAVHGIGLVEKREGFHLVLRQGLVMYT